MKLNLPFPPGKVRREAGIDRIRELLPVYSRLVAEYQAFDAPIMALKSELDNLLAERNGDLKHRIVRSKQLGRLNSGEEAIALQLDARRQEKVRASNEVYSRLHPVKSDLEILVKDFSSVLTVHAAELQTRTCNAIADLIQPYCDGRQEAIKAAGELFIMKVLVAIPVQFTVPDLAARSRRVLEVWEAISPYFAEETHD